MSHNHRRSVTLAFFILGVCVFYFAGLPDVPFHPDEQTYLFMSGDFERLFTRPSQLFWEPDQPTDLRQKYRLRDAPLARWLIGIGRQVTRLPAPEVDWDWTKDWQANRQNGALPDANLLLSGRWSVAFLFPFSLWLMFHVAKSIGRDLCGWMAMSLLASHALVLLHTRRAMAESGLLFGILLTLWAAQRLQARPHWLAIPAALAFNAKQSAVPLAIVCFGLTLTSPGQSHLSPKQRLAQAIAYSILFGLVTLALNPVLWSNPVGAAIAAWQERTALVKEQVKTIQAVDPASVWQTYPQRVAGMLVHLYFAKPAVADVENYLAETHPSEEIYFSHPFHSLFRNIWGGTVWLFLGCFGFVLAPIQARHLPLPQRRLIWFLIIATVFQVLGLVGFVPLPFQRYVVPLIPFQCLWAAKGVEGLVQFSRGLLESSRCRTAKDRIPTR